MPPKTRSSGKTTRTVVKKTKKVVKETVEVVVVSPTEDDISKEDFQNAVSSSMKETEKVEVIIPLAPTLINIPVEDPTEKTPPLDQDEDETQPAESQEPPEKDETSQPQQNEVTTPPPQETEKKRKQTPESTDLGDTKAKAKKKKRAKVGRSEAGLTAVVYKRYVYRVLKQVHPGLMMSSKAMNIVNNMMNDICERIAEEAAKLSAYSKKKTLSSLDVQDAVKLVLPGELGKHAVAEGAKAVTRYASNVVVEKSNAK